MKPIPTIVKRATILPIFIISGCILAVGLGYFLNEQSIGVMLFDSKASYYPFSVQNIMWCLFFAGLGELYIRWMTANRELCFLSQGYLPQDQETVLQPSDLPSIRKNVTPYNDGVHGFLPSLIDLCILQFQASRSVDQTVSVLNSQLSMLEHRLDLRYTLIRYVIWVIPTVGFIGTVIGIAGSLAIASQTPDDPNIEAIVTSLALAFNTTLVSLVLSAVLVLFQHIVQGLEESGLNKAGNYTLTNLINRLFSHS